MKRMDVVPLISPDQLEKRVKDPAWVVVDLRTDLHDPAAGRRKWLRGRIPGSILLDLDRDLSDVSDPGEGRHPLPSTRKFVERLRRLGVGKGRRLAVYDDLGGAIATRLWWMMRWLQGLPVVVLDGGLSRWIAEGGALEQGRPSVPRQPDGSAFPHAPRRDAWVSLRDVRQRPAGCLLLDARREERFRGESEPIDPRAGHIPGAVHAPFEGNLTGTDRRFKSPAELFDRFAALGAANADSIICYCGSGVTACHNLLALELAGIPGSRLFVGSWSQWCLRVPPSAAEISPRGSSVQMSDISLSDGRRADRMGSRPATFARPGG